MPSHPAIQELLDRILPPPNGHSADVTSPYAQGPRTGGGAGDGDITADMLLKMPMDEFEAWCTKNPARAKRLMPG